MAVQLHLYRIWLTTVVYENPFFEGPLRCALMKNGHSRVCFDTDKCQCTVGARGFQEGSLESFELVITHETRVTSSGESHFHNF